MFLFSIYQCIQSFFTNHIVLLCIHRLYGFMGVCLRLSINVFTTIIIAILLSVINIIDLLSYRKHIYVYHDAFLTVINPHLNLSTRSSMSALFSFNKRAYRARNKVIRGASHKLGKVMIVMGMAIAI